jgi:heat shock protein 4
VRTNAKAAFKLRLQCEKLKKTLSANPEAPLNVECLMDDVDAKAHVTREQLEEWAAPGLARLRKCLEEGLAASGGWGEGGGWGGGAGDWEGGTAGGW